MINLPPFQKLISRRSILAFSFCSVKHHS